MAVAVTEIRAAAALTAVAAGAIAILLAVNAVLQDTAAARHADNERRQTAAVLTGVDYDNDILATQRAIAITLTAVRINALTAATENGQAAAVVAHVDAPNGYGGAIALLFAIRRDAPAARPALRILRHRETPGLADFLKTTRGREIYDGVSGATITATAIRAAVDEAAMWLRNCLDWQAVDITAACPGGRET